MNGAAPPAPSPAPEVGRDTADIQASLDRPDVASPWRPSELNPQAAADKPLLEGVKVVDLGAYYAGPYSSRVLADFGADVIKLETIAGDQLRGIERPFFAAQAGKRAISANLKEAALRPAIEGLIKWADIVHHNMRPGAAERLGLGHEQVRAINPDAIYLYAPGWGSTGPFSMRQSFAPMLSGYVGSSFEVAGQYNDPLPSVGNEDPGNGMLGAIGMMLALLDRRRTGAAAYCENPQLNAALGMLAHIVRDADGEAIGAARLDVLQMGVGALESLYQTSDGWICLAVRTDPEIAALQAGLGIDILGDARFATVEARGDNRDDLADLLRAVFDGRPISDWIETFAGTPVCVVQPAGSGIVHELMNDPEQRAAGRVAEAPHAAKGNVREIAHLVRVSDSKVVPHRLAPELGQHTDEILTSLGYAPGDIVDLRKQGSIR